MMLSKEAYEIPEVMYHPASGKTRGGMGIRFNTEDGWSWQYVDLNEGIIKIFIKFTGEEKICWDCGGNRELIVKIDFDGNLRQFDEACDIYIDPHQD